MMKKEQNVTFYAEKLVWDVDLREMDGLTWLSFSDSKLIEPDNAIDLDGVNVDEVILSSFGALIAHFEASRAYLLEDTPWFQFWKSSVNYVQTELDDQTPIRSVFPDGIWDTDQLPQLIFLGATQDISSDLLARLVVRGGLGHHEGSALLKDALKVCEAVAFTFVRTVYVVSATDLGLVKLLYPIAKSYGLALPFVSES